MNDNKPSQNSAKELFKPIQHQPRFSRGRKILIAVFLILSLILAWFLSSANAILIRPEPGYAQTHIKHWLKLPFGQDVLMLPGKYQVEAQAPGYYPYSEEFELGDDNLELNIVMTKLPGDLQLRISDSWQGQEIVEAAKAILKNDTDEHEAVFENGYWFFDEIPAGNYLLQIAHPFYLAKEQAFEIKGMAETQKLNVSLDANYGLLKVQHENEGAQLRLNDTLFNDSTQAMPLTIGDYDVCLELEGFKTQCQWAELLAQQEVTLAFEPLLPADASLKLSSNPSGANVTINGQFRGQTPLNIALAPGELQKIKLFKDGYQRFSQNLTLQEKETKSLHARLNAQLGQLSFRLQPGNTKVFAGNKRLTLDKQGRIKLPSHPVTLRFEAPGFASQSRRVTPSQSRPLKLDIKLLTLEQQKFANLKNEYRSKNGQLLKLFKPNAQFTMGASRRDQGRRANEIQRRIKLDKAFYLASHEISNKQFREFKQNHNSNHSKGVSLNNDSYPVANISWQDAALYCNWLSKREKLNNFYKVSQGKVVGFNPEANGYRLPTEAEWAWAARYENGKMKKYAWGDRMQHSANKANYNGNYADRAGAAQVGNIVNNYDDGYAASAPSGKFRPNSKGLYDMGGNMAEWVNDVYGIKTGLSQQQEHNPMGQQTGTYRVIRGPSWTSGTMSDLRLAFRDYGDKGKRHVGFRIARSAL
ncbi:SUMF1/EgtB/PvdO family nonheme iron enzyme [Pseudoteredinibacter isoporae]|uniref:Formylglycine-generating enzyme required for sulfatase activity n=1 Tax=Pseudoteredinibacter isoporae TaxID=570281 RepID=A0A7X0JVA1_9GAMM|nr:SUMF1/EgtB/PvdO family nonheme iron enzyme [Pseudoteredinibacter isoporae]MBB6522383.1 formylglycine-generating enzyme required for sulfatase activity [Pseudoteredinibacter isoporae]NHO87916.1 SUMF1/EgtB/PvdO family nonheme iron enzyme [Pseudoteredinibacter isoporae]NIB23753.1 SUMF1/EgtB/PvdO family nonheme iron enzyme [Pseudoteredinibacter isoporae]